MTLYFSRTALVLLAGASLCACTTYDPLGGQLSEPLKPNYPVRAEQTAPSQPAPAASASSPTAARELPPAAPRDETPPSATGVPEPNYSPPPNYGTPTATALPPVGGASSAAAEPPAATRPAPPPVMQTVTRATITGKVVDAEGPPKIYTVDKGDTLYGLSRKMGLSVDDLAKANGLKSPYRLQPGQKLSGPRSKAKAYVVGEGDTLFAISRRFNVSAGQIAEANNMAVSATIHPGDKLVLPEGFKDSGPVKVTTQVAVEQPRTPAPPVREPVREPPPTPVYKPAPPPPTQTAAPTTPATKPVAAPVRPATTPVPATPAPTTPAPAATKPAGPVIVPSTPSPADQQISQLGRGRFIWPLRGDILSTFGPKGTGQRNDGINVRTPADSVVRAAAAGDVVYAGDQVPGFGNLVLIKHADGWVTAYGHLGRVDVKMQQQVTQGQQIGMSGATGGVSEPQLHFEVRYAPTPADRARPIDPLLVLPK